MTFTLSIKEIFDIIIMSLALGFMFKDAFMMRQASAHSNIDPLERLRAKARRVGKFDLEGFKFAVAVTAPAIILHELGHKLVAIMFGLQATFQAAYTWLAVGVGLKLLNFGFIFFVPAYVSIIGNTTPLKYSLIAFAGPGTNLILWFVSHLLLKNKEFMKHNKKLMPWLVVTKKINMFLFIFNMLPLPMFDGYKVYSGLFQTFA